MSLIDTARLRALAEAASPGGRTPDGSLIVADGGATVGQAFGINWRNDQAYLAAIDPPTLISLLDELEKYRSWKAEAIDVLLEWEKTWVAAGCPGRLGASKALSVRQEIERLRDEGVRHARDSGA